jgi:hypothetical protein
MGSRFDRLTPAQITFISRQKMFFDATAAAEGRVNLSPKGMDSLRVLDPNRIVWLNLTGSGNETAAHLLDNPRMTVMFCAFDGAPLIVRAYGQARNIRPDAAEWDGLAALFPPMAGARQIFDLAVDLTLSSCGSGVPYMAFQGGRGEEQLEPHWAAMGPERVAEYQQRKNSISLDGKPTDIAPS